MLKSRLLNSLLLWAMCAAAPAQWLNLPTKGIPRTKDGKPDLAAAVPKASNGKPDLSGLWETQGPKYLANIAADMKPGELPIQPWAEALTKERMTGSQASEEYNANCLPQGVTRINATPNPFKIPHLSDLA